MKRMIIDCDPGHDDAIALILAHHVADVVGITTVSGNAPLTATTENALMVTALLGVDTPVHAGAAGPLVGEPVHAAMVHGESGLGTVDRIPHSRRVASDDAVGYLLEAATDDIWIVAIGPLTNLALAIDRDPTWTERIAGIAIMGGSADVGNATPVAEFNIYADPEAAARVFESGVEVIMCGLNLTHQFRTDDSIAERLRAADVPTARFAAQICDDIHGRMESLTGKRTAALHDPCAVLAVTHPELIETEARAVAVEVDGTLTRGMTVVDQRVSRRRNPPNARVGYRIAAEASMAIVLRALGCSGASTVM